MVKIRVFVYADIPHALCAAPLKGGWLSFAALSFFGGYFFVKVKAQNLCPTCDMRVQILMLMLITAHRERDYFAEY
jgi:hypothetical protein